MTAASTRWCDGPHVLLRRKSGAVLWSKDFVKDFKTKLPIWGMVASPWWTADQLITLVGGENASW